MINRFGVLFALTMWACIGSKVPESPPSLTVRQAEIDLHVVVHDVVEGYRRCPPDCERTYSWTLNLVYKVNEILSHWDETGAEGRFRCFMRHLEEPLAVLAPGSRGNLVASAHAVWAPSECSF